MVESAYLPAEGKAREEIDRQLAEAGWIVQSGAHVNVAAGPGVAVHEFSLDKPHGHAQPQGRMLSGRFQKFRDTSRGHGRREHSVHAGLSLCTRS